MNLVTKLWNLVKKYPFSILFAVIFLSVYAVTYSYSEQDKKDYIASEKRLDQLALDSFDFKACVLKDTSKSTTRLLKSVMMLRERKDNAMADATYYYEGTYIFSHILGILSILGVLLLLMVIPKGWEGSGPDLKLAIGAIFMTCSVCYFIPKLMNNEKNYQENINTYYTFSKQINYSSKVLSFHCCCDTSPKRDSLMIAAADSNFNVINNNLTMYYDINFDEAVKYFDEFKSDKTFKKQ